jgi:hypothetical protein
VVTAEVTPVVVRTPLMKPGDERAAWAIVAAWEADDDAEAIPAAPIALSATSTLTETLFLEVENRMVARPLMFK